MQGFDADWIAGKVQTLTGLEVGPEVVKGAGSMAAGLILFGAIVLFVRAVSWLKAQVWAKDVKLPKEVEGLLERFERDPLGTWQTIKLGRDLTLRAPGGGGEGAVHVGTSGWSRWPFAPSASINKGDVTAVIPRAGRRRLARAIADRWGREVTHGALCRAIAGYDKPDCGATEKAARAALGDAAVSYGAGGSAALSHREEAVLAAYNSGVGLTFLSVRAEPIRHDGGAIAYLNADVLIGVTVASDDGVYEVVQAGLAWDHPNGYRDHLSPSSIRLQLRRKAGETRV